MPVSLSGRLQVGSHGMVGAVPVSLSGRMQVGPSACFPFRSTAGRS